MVAKQGKGRISQQRQSLGTPANFKRVFFFFLDFSFLLFFGAGGMVVERVMEKGAH